LHLYWEIYKAAYCYNKSNKCFVCFTNILDHDQQSLSNAQNEASLTEELHCFAYIQAQSMNTQEPGNEVNVSPLEGHSYETILPAKTTMHDDSNLADLHLGSSSSCSSLSINSLASQ